MYKENLNPFFSIITVVFNEVELIERTILSVINQKYQNFEYIVIDGGSTDGTKEIINKYINKIDIFISESDDGIYDAMNKAIKKANGEWLNFMNASDIFANCNILQQVVSTISKGECNLVYSDWLLCDTKNPNFKQKLKKASWDKGMILHQSIFYKKELHNNYGLYLKTDNIFISDYFFFSLISNEKIKKINFPISINDINGVSYGNWSLIQKNTVDYLFSKINFVDMCINILFLYIKWMIKKNLNIFLKNKIK